MFRRCVIKTKSSYPSRISPNADMLVKLDLAFHVAENHLVFAAFKDPVKDTMTRYGLLKTIDHTHFYPTIVVIGLAFYNEIPEFQDFLVIQCIIA